MEFAGGALGRRTPDGHVSVAHRAQRFPQSLVIALITTEDQRPRIVGAVLRAGQLIGDTRQEAAHRVGVLEGEPRRGPPIARFDTAHGDPDTFLPDRVEGILVGQVVAQVDGQLQVGAVDLSQDPVHGLAFVPVDVRA